MSWPVILNLIPWDDSGFSESTRVRTYPFAAWMLKPVQHDAVLTKSELFQLATSVDIRAVRRVSLRNCVKARPFGFPVNQGQTRRQRRWDVKLVARKSKLSGSVRIPGSKSHTIRATAIASLADGTSHVREPLVAFDTLAAFDAYRLMGAQALRQDDWVIRGVGGQPCVADNVIDVGNSGTTLYVALGSAALTDGCTVFTGDGQIRRRPAQPLIDALNALGASVESTRGNGMAPIVVRGPMRGGEIKLDCSQTSQYLTSLLLNCPLARGETVIEAENLTEKPYVEMTLRWLADQGIELDNDDFRRFRIPGGQSYKAFDKAIPADFSSATFFMCAAAITRSDLTLLGLDMNDSQGDKAVAGMLAEMGATVEYVPDGIRIIGGALQGADFDLADTPDALPALAVTACFAEGETRLFNVPQARLKETDRISVMREELEKMGADVDELPDGLAIRGSYLTPTFLHGHADHRVIMALAMAGLAAYGGDTTVYTAEALSVTFPNFVDLMNSIGGEMSILE